MVNAAYLIPATAQKTLMSQRVAAIAVHAEVSTLHQAPSVVEK
jgi:hypothetical protein